MKKRLESELISIAHRILKLKNKSDVDLLYKETQKLYETLAVLKFYHENFESVKSDVSEVVLDEKLQQFNKTIAPQISEVEKEEAEPISVIETEIEVPTEPEADEEVEDALEVEAEEAMVSDEKEEAVEEVLDEEEVLEVEEPLFTPAFELEVEEEEVESLPIAVEEKEETKKIALEHFLGENYVDPVFVKPNEVSLFSSEVKEEEEKKEELKEEIQSQPIIEIPKTAAMSDAMSKSIAIGLNDRIGFVQHLFNDSNEDFNRVISQLNTFDTFEEAKTFINEMVIPDYNYWVGKEDYLERFMEIVEKKFA